MPAHDRRAAARSQLIKLLAARLVREALAEPIEGQPDDDDKSVPVRAVQHRQAARNID